MKSHKCFFALLIGLISLSSCKKDTTSDTDITAFSWKLISVSSNAGAFEPENRDYHREDAFILSFENDSMFTLNTSVNHAGGKYFIPEKGEINVVIYHEFTEVYPTDADEISLNENLITVFGEVSSYTIKGRTLTFKGAKGEVVFKKK